MSSWKDQIVANVVAAREDPQTTTTSVTPAPVANAPAPAPAADVSAAWSRAIAKAAAPTLAALQTQQGAQASHHAPAAAPAPVAMDFAAMWAKAKAKASAPVIAQLRAMGLQ